MSKRTLERAELKGSADNAIRRVKADGNASIHVGSDYNIYLPTERQQITQDSTISGSLSKQIMLVPYHPTNRFQGRFRELNDIHDYFRAPRAADERQLRIVSIRGLGGMGKTQLALQYIFSNKQSYRGIFWLRGEDKTILQQDYAQIARRIDPADSHEPDLNRLVHITKHWLQTTDERWILVFDNVDNVDSAADMERDYWPYSGCGDIIVTTRDRDVAYKLSNRRVHLQGFDLEEGAQLLLRYMDSSQPVSQCCRDIVKELGGLAVAICQMGSYIQQTSSTLEEFHQLIRKRDKSLRLYADEQSTMALEYNMTVSSCCDLSFKILRDNERHLLAVLSFLQTDEIQETLITKGCTKVPRLQYLSDLLERNDIIRALDRHGLLRRYQHKSGSILWVHRVVKTHSLHILDAGDNLVRYQVFEDAVNLVYQAFPTRPPDGSTMCKKWDECEKWLPHVFSLKESYQSSSPTIGRPPRAYAELLCNCTYYMWERGLKHATSFAADTLQICDLALKSGHCDPLRADVLTMLGALNIGIFQTRKSCAEFFQQALDIRQFHMELPGIRPTDVDRLQLANAYNNSGAGCLAVGENDRALYLFQQALSIKRTFGDEESMPYEIAISLYNICRVQMNKRLFQAAKENAEKAWKLAEGKNGRDDFRTNMFRFTYAELLIACGEVEKGLDIHEDILSVRKRVMGVYNNDTGVSYYALSCIYQQLGRLTDALDMIDLAVTVFNTEVLNAEDRAARSFFRRYLILDKLGQEKGANEALEVARSLRIGLMGDGAILNDSVEIYDSLVTYHNK